MDQIERDVMSRVFGVHRRNGGAVVERGLDLAIADPRLKLDSLDLAEIVASLEKQYQIPIFEQPTTVRTWMDVCWLLRKNVAGDASGV